MKLFSNDQLFMLEVSDPTLRPAAITKLDRRRKWLFCIGCLWGVLWLVAAVRGQTADAIYPGIMCTVFLVCGVEAQADLRLLRVVEMLQSASQKKEA